MGLTIGIPFFGVCEASVRSCPDNAWPSAGHIVSASSSGAVMITVMMVIIAGPHCSQRVTISVGELHCP